MPRRQQRGIELLELGEIAELDAVLVLQPVEAFGLPVVHEEQNDRGDDRKAPAENVEEFHAPAPARAELATRGR